MERIYTLVLSIAEPDLRTLASTGCMVVVAKATGSSAPNVAWLAAPGKPQTTIAWEERYGLYASETPLRCGAEIEVASAVYPAVDRHVYPYAAGGFGLPAYGMRVPHGHYDVRNDDRAAMTFGLLQRAWVDSRPVQSPLNAVVVPADFTADFTTAPRLYVWTQRAVAACSVLPNIPPTAKTIEFDGAHRARSCRYDGEATAFVEL
jgi:hypothetical protein